MNSDPRAEKIIQALAAEAKKRAGIDVKLRQWALEHVKAMHPKATPPDHLANAQKVLDFLTNAPSEPHETETQQ